MNSPVAKEAAEVERLCENLAVAHAAGDGDEDLPYAIAMLRALLAERDAARKQAREVTAALETAAHMSGSGRAQVFVQSYVEGADWAVADVAKALAARALATPPGEKA